MDPTILAAGAGIVGGIMGAVVGDAYNSSPVLRDHLSTCTPWYADDFLRLLPTSTRRVDR